jgi:hypothetical protein
MGDPDELSTVDVSSSVALRMPHQICARLAASGHTSVTVNLVARCIRVHHTEEVDIVGECLVDFSPTLARALRELHGHTLAVEARDAAGYLGRPLWVLQPHDEAQSANEASAPAQ